MKKRKKEKKKKRRKEVHICNPVFGRVAATVLTAGVLFAGAGCSHVATGLAPVASEAKADGSFRDCADCPEMVVIPSGSFIMGSPADEPGRYDDESPQRRVSVPRFALGKYEVTQGQWKAIMGHNPSYFRRCGDNCPVENVSWNDAQQFIRTLNQKTGESYRLPTEAEWEYAARSGTSTVFYTGTTITANQANFSDNERNSNSKVARRNTTVRVGSFAPNAFGLYDMQGNVWEWVQDCWRNTYNDAPSDGSAWLGDKKKPCNRVLRGGSWGSGSESLRSADRARSTPNSQDFEAGFRLARAY